MRGDLSPDLPPDTWETVVRLADGRRRHDVLVEGLIARGWLTTGLREELRGRAESEAKREGSPVEDTEWGDVLGVLADANIRPDAWRIVEEGRAEGWGYPVSVLELAEVVVTHDLDEYKSDAYRVMVGVADACDFIAVRLLGYDLRGREFALLDRRREKRLVLPSTAVLQTKGGAA